MSVPALLQLAVVPILVGPLQVFLAMLPAILFGIGSGLLALLKPKTFKLLLRLLWRMKVSILLAIALLTGTVYAARAVWRSAQGPVGQADAGAHEWPLFRGNARRTGAVESGSGPLGGGINWAFADEAKTFHSSPTVVGNRVYVTSAEVGVFSNRGTVYCLDADTGGVVWKSAPEGFRATFSSPCVAGKYLVTGEGLHQVKDGRITCLDTTRGGAVLWTFRTKSHVESTAAVADGRAIIGAGDDGYYCFRLEPDAKGQPVLLWHLPGDQYPDAENDPLIHEGRAYLGLGIGGQAVVCVDVETGKEQWRIATSAPVFAPPTIARGKLFIGMGHGNFVETEEEIIAAVPEKLRAAGKGAAEIEKAVHAMELGGEAWCIDLGTHQVDWKFKTDTTVLGAIVAGEDRLFVASRGGTVYSVGYDGRRLGTWNARAPLIASLAASASHVYAVTGGGRLFALEQGALQPVWEARLGKEDIFISSPALARGHLYVGSPEDGLLCLGQPGGQAAPRIWAGDLGGAGHGGNPARASLPEEAKVEWRWPGNDADTLAAPAAASDRLLFVPLDGPARRGVTCLQVDGPAYEAPTERWFFPTVNGVSASPGASGEAVVFSDNGRTQAPRLHYVNAASGKEHWSAEIAVDALGFACLTADAVLAEERLGWLTSFDLKGMARWREALDGGDVPLDKYRLAGPPCVADSRIIATTADTLGSETGTNGQKPWAFGREGGLVVLDELDGTSLWRVKLSGAPTTGPIVSRNKIFVGSGDGISAYRLVDGKLTWGARIGPVKNPLVQCGNFIATTTLQGELVVLDSETGSVHLKQTGATAELPPLPLAGALLFATSEGLMRLNLADGTVAPWLVNNLTRAITSPLIVSREAAIFTTEQRRLIRAGKGMP